MAPVGAGDAALGPEISCWAYLGLRGCGFSSLCSHSPPVYTGKPHGANLLRG